MAVQFNAGKIAGSEPRSSIAGGPSPKQTLGVACLLKVVAVAILYHCFYGNRAVQDWAALKLLFLKFLGRTKIQQKCPPPSLPP